MLTNIRRVACVIGTLAAGASILALPALAQEARPAMMKRLWPALAILVFLAAEFRAEKKAVSFNPLTGLRCGRSFFSLPPTFRPT